MRILLPLLTFAFILTGCMDEAESNGKSTTKTAEATTTIAAPSPLSVLEETCQNGTFPGSKKVNSNTHPFGKACHLYELSGIRMENPTTIHLCQSELSDPEFHDIGAFKVDQVKQTLGKHAEKANLLASYGFAGKHFSLLLFKDHATSEEFVVSTKAGLKNVPLTLTSDGAALAWAYLHGVLGTHNGHTPYFASKTLCGATLTRDKQGWHLKNADVFVNCQPREKRDIRISNHGEVTIVKRISKPNEPALCID